MLLGKTKKAIEGKENDIRLNLSNNYKDTAYKEYLEYVDIINGFRSEGKISEKDYAKLAVKIEEFKKILKDYIK